MRPVVVDTSIWVEWLRGRADIARAQSRGRVLLMPAVVVLELHAGARTAKAKAVIGGVVATFQRHSRILVPELRDYRVAGEAIAKLHWRATAKANDALIAVCARTIGAEVWTANLRDFAPLGKVLHVPVIPFD